MPSRDSIPSPAAITIEQIKACVTLYSGVVEAHYNQKIKDPKKASEAIKRDAWRYHELPKLLRDQYTANKEEIPLNLAQLEKLVQWKITHGHNRPFLPAMIRKNDAETIKSVTAKAAKSLSIAAQPLDPKETDSTSFWPEVRDAVETLGQLKGVGPATASLVASVYAPAEVPFFADETFVWLLKVGDEQPKLKYDKKEYLTLFNAVQDVRKRLGRVDASCEQLENAAFVLMHLDLLEVGKRKELEAVLQEEQSGKAEEAVDEASKTSRQQQRTNGNSDGKRKVGKNNSKRELETIAPVNGGTRADENQRRSKRIKT